MQLSSTTATQLFMEYYCSRSRRLDFAGSHFFGVNATTATSNNFNNSEIANDFATSSNTMLATPPRELLSAECNALLHPYSFSYQFSCSSHFSASPPFSLSEFFMPVSSLADSPLSSPSSDVGWEECELMWGTVGSKRSASTSPLINFQLGSRLQDSNQVVSSCSYSTELEDPPIPDGIKMPQRKGGIQLWQFLYALLTDPDQMHPELIEWTWNKREREFRLLEPEAIAVWWGYHKNKVNMNYEKFSRSLRYYYDKGILRKIPGERYVYCFCINPEQMYKHIGISDCRPQIKPMPEDAKRALSKFQTKQTPDLPSGDFLLVTPSPKPLVAPCKPISCSQSDSLPGHQQSPCIAIGSDPFGASSRVSRPIERSSSFDAVYPTNFTNPSEDFPHMRSTVSVPEGFKYCADSQELYNDTCTALPIHSDNFSTSMSSDFTQSYMGGHTDFNKSYTCYSPISTMSKTLEVPSNLAYSLPNDVCFLASE